jgi:hypothetical protein
MLGAIQSVAALNSLPAANTIAGTRPLGKTTLTADDPLSQFLEFFLALAGGGIEAPLSHEEGAPTPRSSKKKGEADRQADQLPWPVSSSAEGVRQQQAAVIWPLSASPEYGAAKGADSRTKAEFATASCWDALPAAACSGGNPTEAARKPVAFVAVISEKPKETAEVNTTPKTGVTLNAPAGAIRPSQANAAAAAGPQPAVGKQATLPVPGAAAMTMQPRTPAGPSIPVEDSKHTGEAPRSSQPRSTSERPAEPGSGQPETRDPQPAVKPANLPAAPPQSSIHAPAVTAPIEPRPERHAPAPADAPRPRATEHALATPAPTKTATPVREFVLQIPSSLAKRVEVHVAECAGRVRVTVRSADPQVTAALRLDLGELVRTVTGKGMRIETWTPADSYPLTGATDLQAAAAGSEAGSANRDGSGQQQRQETAPDDQGEKRQPRPDWLAELEERLGKD